MQKEIYIDDPDVELNYFNQSKLISARFILNVIDKPKNNVWSWKMLYRSDYFERWLKDEQLLIEKRIDT